MSESTAYHMTPKRMAQVKEYNVSPRGKYQAHKLNARTRGIGFNLTFEQWWEAWKPHWDERGRGKGKYHMCRHGDSGPYEIGNIYLALHEQNCGADKPKKIGCQGVPLPEESIKMIHDLHNFGVKVKRIADHVGCSRGTVSKHIKHNGFR